MREDIFETFDSLVFANRLTRHARTGSEGCLEGQLCRLPLHDAVLFLHISRLEVGHDDKHRLTHNIFQVARNSRCDIEHTLTGAKATRTYVPGTACREYRSRLTELCPNLLLNHI